MIKRIRNIIHMDMTGSFRDTIALYSLVSPILLALIIRLLVPSIQETELRLAVYNKIDDRICRGLHNYGIIELYDSEIEIIERVNQNDDTLGIYYDNDEYVIISEGNEDPEAAQGAAILVADAVSGTNFASASFDVTDLHGKPAPVLEYAAAMMLLLSMFIGGLLIGFTIVDEKETKAITALAVSPLRIGEYILARGVIALIIGVITGYISCIILLGFGINYGVIGLSIIFSLSVSIPFGFILGSFADNQLTAFALLKLLMAVFITIPFVSIFVPDNWQWIFYLFPNYWMFVTMKIALAGTAHIGFWPAAIITLVSGLTLMAILFPKIRKGVKLR